MNNNKLCVYHGSFGLRTNSLNIEPVSRFLYAFATYSILTNEPIPDNRLKEL